MYNKEEFILKAFDLGVIKFGDFRLKSGQMSPYYIDLRLITSFPDLLTALGNLLLNLKQAPCDLICGVPYAALPVSTVMSLISNIPLIIKRKEPKSYGTARILEGVYKKNDRCLLVEDVVSSGESLFETIADIQQTKIFINEILVVIDREQGGLVKLQRQGYKINALYTLTQIVALLLENKKITQIQAQIVYDFISQSSKCINSLGSNSVQHVKTTPKKKNHPVKERLLAISEKKKSRLIASLDLTLSQSILDYAEKIGKSVCAIKLHSDIVVDFSQDFIEKLKKIAQEQDFLLFEDRKFADIGNTAQLQFTKGPFFISTWADMVTLHLIAGPKSLDAFTDSNMALVPIIEMSTAGALTDAHYQKQALALCADHPQVIGIVAQKQHSNHLLTFTPGVHLNTKGDAQGQQYKTPTQALENGADFLIVGRALFEAQDPDFEAQKYRKETWQI